MSWVSSGWAKDRGSLAYAAVETNARWVFRALTTVFAWQPGSREVTWRLEIPDDMVLGSKVLVRAGAYALTFPDESSKTRERPIIAVDPTVGKIAWEQVVDGVPSPGGLASFDNEVFVHAYMEDRGSHWLRLDGATGKIRVRCPNPLATGLVASPRHVFIFHDRFIEVVDWEGNVTASFPGCDGQGVTASNGDVYIHLADPLKD